MAKGILRYLGGDQAEVHSAGTMATQVHPLAVSAMAEKGIDISGQRSKHLDEFAGQAFDFVVAVCDTPGSPVRCFPGRRSGSTGASRTR